MACIVGAGNLAWGGATLTFRAEDGIQEDGVTFAEVNHTAFGDTDEKWCQGDVADYGTVTATGIGSVGWDLAADGADLGAQTLTITYPIPTGGTTAATKAGTAFLVTAPVQTAKNELTMTTVTFRWSSKPTYTAGT